jgi:hypothetical protein
MEQHFKIVAVLQIVMGALSIAIAAGIFAVIAGAGAIATAASGERLVVLITSGVGAVIAGILILIALPSIIAGVGLMKRHEWARILTIVLSFFHLLHVPFGTIVGAYSIWALLQPDAKGYFV